MTTKIIVEGFKSIGKRVEVEVRPLTILAGANSSGKSSLMQTLLLLKQTMESDYDAGPLVLNGRNAKFTSMEQLLHRSPKRRRSFVIGVHMPDGTGFETEFEWSKSLDRVVIKSFRALLGKDRVCELRPDMTREEVESVLPPNVGPKGRPPILEVVARVFVLGVQIGHSDSTIRIPVVATKVPRLDRLMHIPGLRGNPERSYPRTGTGPEFPGTFENYTASVISRWQIEEPKKIALLNDQLRCLGLTSQIEAKKVNDVEIELQVGRLAVADTNRPNDMVNIADVGLGVSQTLPVLVALLEARRDQFVYVEQPELHLHPKAQVAMAGIIADAAKRGVLVVIETHSSLLLLATQTLVAEGKLSADLVKLHWFERDKKTGATQITSRDLDKQGRFGDWPVDFDDISLDAESRYLDAVEAAMAKE